VRREKKARGKRDVSNLKNRTILQNQFRATTSTWVHGLHLIYGSYLINQKLLIIIIISIFKRNLRGKN